MHGSHLCRLTGEKKIIIYVWVPPVLTYRWNPHIKPIPILKNN
jgi:hypothetical protein